MNLKLYLFLLFVKCFVENNLINLNWYAGRALWEICIEIYFYLKDFLNENSFTVNSYIPHYLYNMQVVVRPSHHILQRSSIDQNIERYPQYLLLESHVSCYRVPWHHGCFWNCVWTSSSRIHFSVYICAPYRFTESSLLLSSIFISDFNQFQFILRNFHFSHIAHLVFCFQQLSHCRQFSDLVFWEAISLVPKWRMVKIVTWYLIGLSNLKYRDYNL